MGAADAVPGVSGGTIAFISGIYEELISTISNIKPSLFKTLFKDGIKPFWKALNGSFLLALGSGILVSFVSFMKLAKYLLEYHPILIWSFFFGLIIASIYFVAKQISKWSISVVLAFIIGATLAYYITTVPALSSSNSSGFLFIAGAIAICAMILPGISGSFILIILGAYKMLSEAFDSFDIKKILIFASGALVGLLSFSHLLKWLFKNYSNITLALLSGFILGSLNKVWPWKKTELVLNDSNGNIQSFSEISNLGSLSVYQKKIGDFESYKTVLEKSISPNTFANLNSTEHQLLPAIVLILLGFSIILILEKLGSKN